MFFEGFAYNVLRVGILPEGLEVLIDALKGFEAKTDMQAVLASTMMALFESVQAMRGAGNE